ncbi:MAG: GyrI-like domain-containing protein [Deltaproteobacteria bacterium]
MDTELTKGSTRRATHAADPWHSPGASRLENAQPFFVTREFIECAIADVKKKKNPTAISKVRLESLSEGKCAQIMHIGPFSEEAPTIEKAHQFIDSKSRRTGKHHEIYLSDIRKADPSKWKTIIRQPMQ